VPFSAWVVASIACWRGLPPAVVLVPDALEPLDDELAEDELAEDELAVEELAPPPPGVDDLELLLHAANATVAIDRAATRRRTRLL